MNKNSCLQQLAFYLAAFFAALMILKATGIRHPAKTTDKNELFIIQVKQVDPISKRLETAPEAVTAPPSPNIANTVGNIKTLLPYPLRDTLK